METENISPRRGKKPTGLRCKVTHQHIHIENPAVLPGTDAEGAQVYAALVVKYPVQGVSDLGAKVIASSPFKFWGGIG